jgi:hypothetical protein
MKEEKESITWFTLKSYPSPSESAGGEMRFFFSMAMGGDMLGLGKWVGVAVTRKV